MSVYDYINSDILCPVNNGKLLGVKSDRVYRICKEILYHIVTGSKIFIYGDYDMDGFCCMNVWKEQFKALNHSNVEYFTYSYRTHNIDVSILEQVKNSNPACVIICDTGSSFDDREVLSQLSSYGVSIIVIDHHEFSGDYKTYSDSHLIFNSHEESNVLSGCKISAGYACLLIAGELCKMIPHAVLSNNSKIFALASMYSDVVDVSSLYGRSLYNEVANISLKTSPLLNILNTYNYQLGRRLFSFIIAPPINACFRAENFTPLNMLIQSEDRVQLKIALDMAVAQHRKITPIIKQIANELVPTRIGNFVIYELNGSNLSFYNYTGLLATELSKTNRSSCVVFYRKDNAYKGSFRDSQSRRFLEKFSLFCDAGGHGSAFGLTFYDKSEFMRNLHILSQISDDSNDILNVVIPSKVIKNEDDVLALVLYNEYMNYNPHALIEVKYNNPTLISSNRYNKEYDVGLPFNIKSAISLAVNCHVLVEPCLCRKPELRVK